MAQINLKCFEILPSFDKPSYNLTSKQFLEIENYNFYKLTCLAHLGDLKKKLSKGQKKVIECPDMGVYKNYCEQLEIEIFIVEFLCQLDDDYRRGKLNLLALESLLISFDYFKEIYIDMTDCQKVTERYCETTNICM